MLLLAAMAAGLLLQFVGAFAVMIPAMAIKELELSTMNLSAGEEAVLLNEFISGLTGPTLLVTHLVLFVCFGLWYGFGCCRQRNFTITFRRTFSPRNLGVIVLLAVSCCYFTNFFMPIASEVIPERIMQDYIDLMETAGFGESILPTLTSVLIAPFGEELIFRGVTYHYASRLTEGLQSRRKAFYIANTIQALAFGIFHGNLVQGTYAFLLGLVLGYLRERFGSIWASILAHMLINGISSFLWEPLFYFLPESMAVFGGGSVLCLLLMILGFQMGGPAVTEKTA